jgi:hypothetical protein
MSAGDETSGSQGVGERTTSFLAPSSFERLFNSFFGLLVRYGLGLRHNYLVEVRGRKSGRIYSTPIDLLELSGRKYLVCPRGRAQWVRNAEVSLRATLRKGGQHLEYELRAVPDAEKPELLRNYLDRFKITVQRYFPVPANSPASAFAPIASRYPVFELLAPTSGGER